LCPNVDNNDKNEKFRNDKMANQNHNICTENNDNDMHTITLIDCNKNENQSKAHKRTLTGEVFIPASKRQK